MRREKEIYGRGIERSSGGRNGGQPRSWGEKIGGARPEGEKSERGEEEDEAVRFQPSCFSMRPQRQFVSGIRKWRGGVGQRGGGVEGNLKL